MLLVERETPEGVLVSVCDADDLGKTFETSEASITADPDFYDGDPADESEVTDALARCTVANLVGTRAVGVAIEAGFVAEENVLEFEESRHAQYLEL
ncbi:MAG: DUF424 domain-containing protein [Halobacteriales archaeon]|nr:DUF424 domain-containing protein [Halobacteriales archaeon]